jgi:mRNA interferase MazF
MNRGELYLVRKPGSTDPRKRRVFVVVSRQVLLESKYSTVICAPVYSARSGLTTQVDVGPESGLKHESAIHCDELVSLGKNRLTEFVGSLSPAKVDQLNRALAIAVGLS